jgi:hypothetical protein
MGFSMTPPPNDSWHTGSLNPGTGGARDGYKPNLGSVAQAEYATKLDEEAAAAKHGRLGRITRALRRLFWEF